MAENLPFCNVYTNASDGKQNKVPVLVLHLLPSFRMILKNVKHSWFHAVFVNGDTYVNILYNIGKKHKKKKLMIIRRCHSTILKRRNHKVF